MMIKKYQGLSYFRIEVSFIVFTIVLPFILYFIKNEIFNYKEILFCWSFSMIFYLLGGQTWWNVYLYDERIVLKNNWLFFKTNKLEFSYDKIEYINVEFYNWSGIAFRRRPIITIKGYRMSKRFRGIDHLEAKDLIKLISSLDIRITNDLK